MKRALLFLLVIGWIVPAAPPHPKVLASNYSADLSALSAWQNQLQTGDLVFRCGKGFISGLLKNTSRRCRVYSHVGVVVIEDGRPMVYHMLDDLNDKKAFSGLKKESFSTFASPTLNKRIGVYRYPLTHRFKSGLIHEMKTLAQRAPRFDDAFDLNSDDRLYCTEMIWKYVLSKGGVAVAASQTPQGSFIGLDDLHLAPEAKMVFHLKYNP